MQRIDIIAVGHLKEKYLKEASSEYEKRLSTLCKLKITEIEPAKLPDNPNPSQISAALEQEAAKILAAVPTAAEVYPMCIEGKQFSSEELSHKLDSLAVMGKSSVCFIIGGSYGLSNRVKGLGKKGISMSKMTFPHQLARIMLLEQIYRAYKISMGGTYHK
jgi:23S rRNA (pseudouridine1915-N3)-methyltransferase